MTQASHLVPEGFDLEAALHAKSSTPRGELPHCPECGEANVKSKTGRACGRPRRKDGDWRCDGCGHHFDHPDYPGTEDGS